MSLAASGFTLIDGAQGQPDAAPSGPIIDVTTEGARGVIAALLSGQTAYLLRDPSAPPQTIDPAPGIWLQTSGTTGIPKWVRHDLAGLTAKIVAGKGEAARWLLTFNPGSFAGLQVILSAMIGGHTLITPPVGADIADMANLAVAQNATHISGTPTFWRAFLMALGDQPLDLKSVTLGGEAPDQGILDALKTRFPNARLRHIYATTEAGTVFSVSDGCAGFPSAWLNNDLSVSAHDTLTVKGHDTGDVVSLTDDRVLFQGRLDAMVNIGGVKVYPETVEAHLLQLPFIQDVRITPKPSPITGHILVAEIVLKPFSGDAAAQIKAHMAALPRAARPAALRFVDSLAIGATGKKLRSA